MSSSRESSGRDRVFDYATNAYVRWSASRSCWVSESNGRPVAAPQTRPSVTSTTAASTRPSASSSRSTRDTARTSATGVADTTASLGSLSLRSQTTQGGSGPATASQGSTARSTVPQASSGVAPASQGTASRSTAQSASGQITGAQSRPPAQYQTSDPRIPLQSGAHTTARYDQTSSLSSTAQRSAVPGASYPSPGQAQRTSSQSTSQGVTARSAGKAPAVYPDPGELQRSSTRSTRLQSTAPPAPTLLQSTTRPTGGRTAPYEATVQDQRTGLQTRWEVTATTPYREPNASSNRGLNVKRIRQVDPRRDRDSETPRRDYKEYQVIEVELVPPEDIETSNVSQITPTAATVAGVRRRRFVIIRLIAERNAFEALAIKTYNGRGVAAPGVIKSHHSIIYTDRRKEPGADEQPQRNAGNQLESPMQTSAIRVIPRDRGTALDDWSRLDYADRYEFDWGVPNIRLFGRVHRDSLAALFVQYNAVWQTIRTAVEGVQRSASQSTVTQTSNPYSTLSLPPGSSSSAQTPAPYISSTAATAATSSRAGSTSSDIAAAQALISRYQHPNSGPCTTQQLSLMLWYYREYARSQGLDPPVVTERQLQELARDSKRRAEYIQQIKARWNERRPNVDDDEDQEEDDDDDDDDDDPEEGEEDDDEDNE